MSEKRLWLWVLVGSLVALVVGFAVAWSIQANRLAAAEKALTQANDRATLASQDLSETTRALDSAIAERDRLRLQAQGGSSTSTDTRTPPTNTTTKTPTKPASSGKRFGYIKKLETKGRVVYVTYDQAEFLTGQAAADAATAHGDESPPPNDYYIVNDNKLLRTFPLSPSCSVKLVTKSDGVDPNGYSSNVSTLISIFNGRNAALQNAKGSPYWLTLKNGVVMAIEEQYLP